MPHLPPNPATVTPQQPSTNLTKPYYLLPGGGVQDIVLTSAAVAHLTGEELHAVTAHERAHATGRHYRPLRLVRLLDRAFPWPSWFATAVRQVCRLVELRADDVAVRSSPPIVLARALVALAEARARQGTAAPGGPAGEWPGPDETDVLLAAHGGDAAERLQRLLHPPRPLPAALARTAAALLPLLPAVPVLIAVVERSPLAP